MERKATVWAGPDGERETSFGHGAEDAWKILWKIYTGEEMSKKPEVSPEGDSVEYKGKSGEEAKADAYQRLVDDGFTENSPRIKVEVLNRGWAIMDDKSWEHPTLMAKTKDIALREEELIMQFLSKGPVNLMFEGANMAPLTMEDVENSPNMSAAMDAAIARSKAPPVESSLWEAGRRAINILSGYDLGPWTRS